MMYKAFCLYTSEGVGREICKLDRHKVAARAMSKDKLLTESQGIHSWPFCDQFK